MFSAISGFRNLTKISPPTNENCLCAHNSFDCPYFPARSHCKYEKALNKVQGRHFLCAGRDCLRRSLPGALTQRPPRLSALGFCTCPLTRAKLGSLPNAKTPTIVGAFVRGMRFELTHPFGRYHLKVVRLPISPPTQLKFLKGLQK